MFLQTKNREPNIFRNLRARKFDDLRNCCFLGEGFVGDTQVGITSPLPSMYGIFPLHLLDFYGFCVGKYTSPMTWPLDGIGWLQIM